ncbi:hypothetical protein VB796_16690 [Arcicella sp. LKC2W]|uniref:hypothetical protein n=1 Tax=Arcicella sp. LKC2W TaxID=2984198 RepID=UPI002B204334|nr:hypothetical protein [Arcicella sp. LKC2W]MEA5460697.1 hypothetical protein [Arcicella sp. LKC2W]
MHEEKAFFMMKILIILFIILGMNLTEKEALNSVDLSYQTRGMQKNLHITSEKVSVTINGEITNYKIKPAQWNKIVLATQKVSLKDISTLKRPSSKSYSDAAFEAVLKVNTSSQEYESISFDHHTPPTELSLLIKTMKATLLEKKQRIDF